MRKPITRGSEFLFLSETCLLHMPAAALELSRGMEMARFLANSEWTAEIEFQRMRNVCLWV